MLSCGWDPPVKPMAFAAMFVAGVAFEYTSDADSAQNPLDGDA